MKKIIILSTLLFIACGEPGDQITNNTYNIENAVFENPIIENSYDKDWVYQIPSRVQELLDKINEAPNNRNLTYDLLNDTVSGHFSWQKAIDFEFEFEVPFLWNNGNNSYTNLRYDINKNGYGRIYISVYDGISGYGKSYNEILLDK